VFAGVCPRLFGLLNRDSSFDGGTIVVIGNRARCGTAACKAGHYKALPQRNRDVCTAWFGHEFPSPPNAFGDLRLACYACVVMKNAPTRERHSERSASIARRVCWWQSAEATKIHRVFSARSWCSGRGKTYALSSIVMAKLHSGKHWYPPHPASLTTVRGIIGTTGSTFSRFPSCHSAPFQHEVGLDVFPSQQETSRQAL